jgi:CxxC motif-containing protein (DUF1111 family)
MRIVTAVALCVLGHAALATLGAHRALSAQTPGVVARNCPDSRTVDAGNTFANVGALITMAEKNDAGVPEGNLGQCTATDPTTIRSDLRQLCCGRARSQHLASGDGYGRPPLAAAVQSSSFLRRLGTAAHSGPARRRPGVSRGAGA